jgi:Immunoglobulin-like domain of bacterial spore germination
MWRHFAIGFKKNIPVNHSAMKCKYLVWVAFFFACNEIPDEKQADNNKEREADSIIVVTPQPDSLLPRSDSNIVGTDTPENKPTPPKTYSNFRFRKVTVKKVGENRYAIKGQGQIFESSFGWVVEDGHYELLKGFEMTDAGAPEWGNFFFTIEVKKQRPNSTLMLVLYEISANDGSRQYELPVLLE